MIRLLTVLSAMLMLTACVNQAAFRQVDGAGTATNSRIIATDLFKCGTERFSVSVTAQDNLVLVSDQNNYFLTEAIAASGAKYQGERDKIPVVFWMKGDTASYSVGDKSVECRRTGALLPLTLIANEPPLHVHFDANASHVNMRYGQEKLVLGAAEIVKTGQQWRYTATAGEHTLVAEVSNTLCIDTMSDQLFPMKATVRVDQRSYQACGGAPINLLAGGEWEVTRLNGVPARDKLTLAFDGLGQLSGTAGCNRYTANYQLHGRGVEIAHIASSRAVCTPAIMAQERRLLEILSYVNQVVTPAEGELVLRNAQGQELLAYR